MHTIQTAGFIIMMVEKEDEKYVVYLENITGSLKKH